jgi:hypothetical protein
MADIRDLPTEYSGKGPFAQKPIQDKFDKSEILKMTKGIAAGATP